MNVYTENDSYPITAIRDIVNWLATKKGFTTLDLRSGYLSVEQLPRCVRYWSPGLIGFQL
jgi:hypothetical protein